VFTARYAPLYKTDYVSSLNGQSSTKQHAASAFDGYVIMLLVTPLETVLVCFKCSYI
jgi:hypothetical protein